MTPRTPKVPDRFSSEIRTENRRVSGITPKLLGYYPESPARMLPKSRGLKALATATKRAVPKAGGL